MVPVAPASDSAHTALAGGKHLAALLHETTAVPGGGAFSFTNQPLQFANFHESSQASPHESSHESSESKDSTTAKLFSHLDGAVTLTPPSPGSAGKTLQVSLPDGANGAVGIEAHFAGGQVSASILVAREPSLHLLAHELPAVQQFLSTHHVDVRTLSIDLTHGDSINLTQSGSGQLSYADQQERREQPQFQEAGAATVPTSAAALSSALSGALPGSLAGDGARLLSVNA